MAARYAVPVPAPSAGGGTSVPPAADRSPRIERITDDFASDEPDSRVRVVRAADAP